MTTDDHRKRVLAHLEKSAMNTNTVAHRNGNGDNGGSLIESVIIKGDLAKLSPAERANYYATVCKSLGLNPLTKPFDYITLNSKLVLYALRACTDQLRTIHGVSVIEMTDADREGVHIVTCKVSNKDGRTDVARGAVNISGLKGENLANAMMKAETKAKRRATLSICGLGFLDETEIEDIPATAKTLPKKDSREIYTKVQAEIDECESYVQLKQWGEDAKDRIAVLPNDWQDHLRLRYQERLVDLRQHQRKPPEAAPITQELVPGETVNHETGEIIWGEPPADDAMSQNT
jgi:hypothetical protein